MFFGIRACINEQQEEVRAINSAHNSYVAAFDESVQRADIYKIPALENALFCLQKIKELENNSKFHGSNVYSSKRSMLIQKTQSIYEEANRKHYYATLEELKQIKAKI